MIHTEFVQQQNFLAEEEQRQLQKLEMEEREHLRILGEREAMLAQKSQALQELVLELEKRSRGSALELLQVSLPIPEVQGIIETKLNPGPGIFLNQTGIQTHEWFAFKAWKGAELRGNIPCSNSKNQPPALTPSRFMTLRKFLNFSEYLVSPMLNGYYSVTYLKGFF